LHEYAYRITPSNAHTLGIICGYGYVVMNANIGWVVFSSIANHWKWQIMPERQFREDYPYLEIKEI